MNQKSKYIQGTVSITHFFSGGYKIEFPDSLSEIVLTKEEAQEKADKWFKEHADIGKENIGFVQWNLHVIHNA